MQKNGLNCSFKKSILYRQPMGGSGNHTICFYGKKEIVEPEIIDTPTDIFFDILYIENNSSDRRLIYTYNDTYNILIRIVKLGSSIEVLQVETLNGTKSLVLNYELQSLNIVSYNNLYVKPGYRNAIAYANDGSFKHIKADTVHNFTELILADDYENARQNVNTYMNSSGQYRNNYGMVNNKHAFAALDLYGRIYAWGDPRYGGIAVDGSYVTIDGTTDLSNIIQIYSTSQAVAALDNSGYVYAWGDQDYGGFNNNATDAKIYATKVNTGSVGNPIENIVQIYSTQAAFAALDKYGDVYAWGDKNYGGFNNVTTAPKKVTISNIVQIYSTESAFAALTSKGYVYAWGDLDYGGLGDPNVATQVSDSGGAIENIVQIYSTERAFAALDKDGGVYAWGDLSFGGFGPNSKIRATKVSQYSYFSFYEDNNNIIQYIVQNLHHKSSFCCIR